MMGRFDFKTWGSRCAAALFVLVMSVAPALAEVCDKTWGVPEDWSATSGPVYRGLVHSPLVTISLIIVVAILLWRFSFSKNAFLLAVLSLGWLWLLTQGDVDDGMREIAVREGCVSDQMDFLVTAIFGTAAVLFSVVGFATRRKSAAISKVTRP